MVGSDDRGAFFSTARVKLISSLAIVALVVGIVAEGVIIRKNKVETDVASVTAFYADKLKAAEAEIAELKARTESEIARNAEELKLSEARRMTAEAEEKAQLAKKAAADAETARAAADNAAKLKLAEADERAQLAKKAAADAEAAREAANSAAKLRVAEAEERAQLAKKAAADAETARAAADNASKLKLAEAKKMAEDAENLRLKNKYLRAWTDGSGDGDRAEMREFNRELDILGLGDNPAPRPREAAAAPELPLLRVKSEESGGKLNLRDGPGRRHGIITELPAGTLLRKVGACVQSDDGVTRDPWCKVDWNGRTGWASSRGLERYTQQ